MKAEKKHPKTPQNLNSTQVTEDSVTLSWDYDGDESLTLYQDGVAISTENSPVVVGGLIPETKYTFKIETDESKLSDTTEVTTLPKEPEVPEVPDGDEKE